ncbi:ABC transporter permease [Alloacidobacterium sp.]|uniref:ABC transporter permease n=1 Tax=Alloacidobacterium sp. TaxID=2951999 RepID=UPI002D4726B8|nr:ABC transporter permease [Alloacidobacterium sp.]HYK36632.1 ABC transporter permease [Alloacidobacterium sp.]
MSVWRHLFIGLRRLVSPASRDKELDEEVRQYFEETTAIWAARGLSPEDAKRAAILEDGNMAAVQEQVRSYGWENSVIALFSDFRYALRQVIQNPGFAIVAIFTLALGIGSATAIFSVVKAVVLNPLPFREPQRLVHLWEGVGDERYRMGDEAYFSSVRPGNYFGWKLGSQSFENMSAYFWRTMLLSDKDRADLVSAHEVYQQFFETLGTPALLGRTLQATDYTSNAGRVVVLSYTTWRNRFAKDPGVLGRRILLDRQSYEIVGVMPDGFYPTPGGRPELWTPHWASQTELQDFSTWGRVVIGRLKPGVTWTEAQTELFVLSAQITRDRPMLEKVHAIVVPMSAQVIGSSWKLLLLLSVGVGLLLLIACVNVANLFLARTVDRQREFAVRAALGASRVRLIQQLISESLVIAAAAGLTGLGFAWTGIHTMLALLPQSDMLPRLDTVRLDLGMLTFVSALTLLISLLFGFIPLLRTSKMRPYDLLKMSGRTASASKSTRRLGQIFIFCEFVFSLVLLILGASLVENFVELLHADPGFDTSHLLVFQIRVPDADYGKYIDGEYSPTRERLYEQLESVVLSAPGVESAGFTERLPLWTEGGGSPVQIEGHAIPPSRSEGDTGTEMVNPDFIQALRLRLVRGRFLEEHDRTGTPVVAVVNESFVRKFLPSEDPIGKHANVWFANAQIVGVVADFKLNALDRNPHPEIFWTVRQSPPRNVWIMARTRANPSVVGDALRQKIRHFDPDLPVVEMQPMSNVAANSLWLKRISADLIGLIAVCGMILAATGIYGITSYAAAQREKEMGIRMAFGADRTAVFGLVMKETWWLALAGSAVGCIAAVIVARVATNISYLSPEMASTQSRDVLHPGVFILSSLFLFAVANVASYAPARRALNTDPADILQHE